MQASERAEALVDLADRWRRARRAALRAVAQGATGEEPDDELLSRALSKDERETLLRVFDNSLRLGRGFARYFGQELSLDDLPGALAMLGAPCLDGAWSSADQGAARLLERPGCAAGALGPGACDFWREAISGLVHGAAEARHTRHESLGHEGARCLDVFYADPQSPRRFGAIPDEMRAPLEGVRRMAKSFDSTVEVEFLGVSEGVLLYQIRKSGRSGELGLSSLVERGVRKRFPRLSLLEISPRGVLDDEAGSGCP